jgi:hypothetical protein
MVDFKQFCLFQLYILQERTYKLFGPSFSKLDWQFCFKAASLHGTLIATSRVENSAQVSSCLLKFAV